MVSNKKIIKLILNSNDYNVNKIINALMYNNNNDKNK